MGETNLTSITVMKVYKNKIAIDDSHLFFSLFYSPFFSPLLCSAFLSSLLLFFLFSFITKVKRSGAPDALDRLLAAKYIQVYVRPPHSASYVTSNVVSLISLHQHPSQRFLDLYE